MGKTERESKQSGQTCICNRAIGWHTHHLIFFLFSFVFPGHSANGVERRALLCIRRSHLPGDVITFLLSKTFFFFSWWPISYTHAHPKAIDLMSQSALSRRRPIPVPCTSRKEGSYSKSLLGRKLLAIAYLRNALIVCLLRVQWKWFTSCWLTVPLDRRFYFFRLFFVPRCRSAFHETLTSASNCARNSGRERRQRPASLMHPTFLLRGVAAAVELAAEPTATLSVVNPPWRRPLSHRPVASLSTAGPCTVRSVQCEKAIMIVSRALSSSFRVSTRKWNEINETGTHFGGRPSITWKTSEKMTKR